MVVVAQKNIVFARKNTEVGPNRTATRLNRTRPESHSTEEENNCADTIWNRTRSNEPDSTGPGGLFTENMFFYQQLFQFSGLNPFGTYTSGSWGPTLYWVPEKLKVGDKRV